MGGVSHDVSLPHVPFVARLMWIKVEEASSVVKTVSDGELVSPLASIGQRISGSPRKTV
jgi:hypothetical protein